VVPGMTKSVPPVSEANGSCLLEESRRYFPVADLDTGNPIRRRDPEGRERKKHDRSPSSFWRERGCPQDQPGGH